MDKMSDAALTKFMKESSELPLNGFIANVENESVLDETIEEMFWEIYKQRDEEKIANALRVLEYNEKRKKLAIEIADAVKNDQIKTAA